MGSLLSTDDFRAAARAGTAGEATVYRFSSGEPATVPGADRVRRFVFSDATVDHAGDSIAPDGWDLSVFSKNPVALWSHDPMTPPIGKASNVAVRNGKLIGDIAFAPPDVSEFADSVYRLVAAGYLKAVSVGFRPLKWAFSTDPARPAGINFSKQLLLEISVCALPCNPNALTEARSKGIDTAPLREWAERLLDTKGAIVLPRTELEAFRSQASSGAERRHYLPKGRPASREARLAEAEALRRDISPRAETPAERLREARDIKRVLTARSARGRGGVRRGHACSLRGRANR